MPGEGLGHWPSAACKVRAGKVTRRDTGHTATPAGPHPNPLPEGEGAIPRVTAGPSETGYDVIKHLVGKAGGGSGDLSTNPEHLARYGE